MAASALPLLEDDLPEATELHGHREPPPSTWFDDLDPTQDGGPLRPGSV